MRASETAPYVGLVVLSRAKMGSRFDEWRERVGAVARGWGEKRRGMTEGEKGGEREVVWAWVDGDKWAQWIKTMYEVKAGEEPWLILADTKASSISVFCCLGPGPELTEAVLVPRAGAEVLEEGA